VKPEDNNAKPPVASAGDWEVLRRSRPEDFDGHTGFERMTPTERLRWLDQAVEFVSRQTALARCRDVGASREPTP